MWQLAAMLIPFTLIFFGLQATVVVGSRVAFPGEHPAPFAQFEAQMPGQVVYVWNVTECSRQPANDYAPIRLCDIHAESEPFVMVQPNYFEATFENNIFIAYRDPTESV